MSEPVQSVPAGERPPRIRLLELARSPEGTVAIYAIIVFAAAVAAYFYLFTQFADYDDEGTSLLGLRAFADGEVLYRDIYAQKGPFFYELFGGFSALTGIALTTDASRTITMLIWAGSSLLFGVSVQRLSGQAMVGITATLVAFTVLSVLSLEPMHAQILVVALLSVFTLVASGVETRRVELAGGACGALLAALVLTKVNIGVYAVAAVCFAAVLAVEPLRRRPWLRWPVVGGFIAVPFVVTRPDLDIELVRNLVVIEVLAAVAIAIATQASRPRDDAGEARTIRWLYAAVAGFGLAFIAILGAIFLTGSSPADVYEGVVTEAMRIRTVNPSQMLITNASLDWAIAAIAGATLVVWLRSRGLRASPLWSGVLRAAAGIAIWFSIAQMAPLSLGPAPGNPNTLAMVLAWVAVVAPAGAAESAQRRFIRVLLAALAIAGVLQTYPVAGSQIHVAAVMFVAVGGICLGDAYSELRAWSAARGPGSLERLTAIAAVAVAALGAKFALDGVVQPTVSKAILYGRERALPFPGATSLHLPDEQRESYERIVELLHSNRCTSFVGLPNIDSLYQWSGIDAPPPYAPGGWMFALDDAKQQRIVDELRETPRPCAFIHKQLANTWLGGSPPPQTPLVRHILDDYRVVDKAGAFQFMLPTDGRSG